MGEEKIELFLKAIEDHFEHLDPRTNWPLNGAQMDAYFDVSEALDIYHRIMSLKGKMSVKEIAKLMPPVDMLRLFTSHNCFVGLTQRWCRPSHTLALLLRPAQVPCPGQLRVQLFCPHLLV